MNKLLLVTFLSLLVLTGCSQVTKPVGCWQDQFESVYRFKPQGVVTKKMQGELRPRHRGNWEMLDDNSFVLQLSGQQPQSYTIVSMNKDQMTIRLSRTEEFTWMKTSCL